MEEKKPLNKNAWFAIGSSIAFFVITLIIMIASLVAGNHSGFNGGHGDVIWSGGGSMTGGSMTGGSSNPWGNQPVLNDPVLTTIEIIRIVAFVLSLITLGVSILGLFFSAAPARDGIFSAVFILHFAAAILTWLLPTWIILLIVCCVFDSLYEGKSRSAAKREEVNY